MYAFIDESGQSGYSSKSSKYFLCAAIIFEDENLPRRIAKKVFNKAKLSKTGMNQVHASDVSNNVKQNLIKEIVKHNFKIEYSIVKKKIKNDYYLETIYELLKKLKTLEIESVTIATKDNRKIVKDKIIDFANSINIKIGFSTPTSEKALQIADFVAWSLFQKHEKDNDYYIKSLLEK